MLFPRVAARAGLHDPGDRISAAIKTFYPQTHSLPRQIKTRVLLLADNLETRSIDSELPGYRMQAADPAPET